MRLNRKAKGMVMFRKFFKKIFKGVKTFVKSFFETTVSGMVESFGNLPLDVVRLVESKKIGFSSEEKRREAYKMLSEILFQRHIRYSTTAVNVAIEMAVAVMQEKDGK